MYCFTNPKFLLLGKPGLMWNMLKKISSVKQKLEYGPMPNVMATLANIGGALCLTPQSLADARY